MSQQLVDNYAPFFLMSFPMEKQPYHPSFTRSAKFVRLLTEASKLESWIRQQSVDVSWIPKSQREALVRLAHYSTRIEGNPLTLPEVEALAAGKDLPVEEKAKREVLNYFAALNWIWRSSPRDVREKDLLHLHHLLTEGLLPSGEVGHYKSRPNAVFAGGHLIYHPPPPEAAPMLTRGLLDWINSAPAEEDHPIVAAAIAHHRLVSIHPVMDGNGRLARSLESWLLYRRGFDTHHIFALDEFFDADRERYYREIQSVRAHEDDLTSWLTYVSEGIFETLKKTQVRIQTLRRKSPAAKITLTPAQERVLQILVETPSMGGRDLAHALALTRSGFNKVIRPLLEAGFVAKEGSTKSAAYHLT
ncbi:MAG: Fic family protein [Elusimicrobia bacterium]|nr:Fic family protein [Candidatus Obscuribacterium magneticum]